MVKDKIYVDKMKYDIINHYSKDVSKIEIEKQLYNIFKKYV